MLKKFLITKLNLKAMEKMLIKHEIRFSRNNSMLLIPFVSIFVYEYEERIHIVQKSNLFKVTPDYIIKEILDCLKNNKYVTRFGYN